MKKRIIAGAMALMMSVLLAACGSTPASGTSVSAPDQEQNGDKIELVYWSMWNEAEPQGQIITQAVAAYEQENPNVDIKINWQGRDITKIIGTKLEAGEKIDIFDSPVNTILPITQDYAADLTELYAKSYPTTNGKPYEEVVLPAMTEVTRTYSREGEINAVSYAPFIQCIFYNKDHFAQAGIDTLPTTWDELMAACEKLKAAGYAPMTMDDAYMPALPGMYLARAKGSEWVSELVKTNSDEMWQDPAVLEMAQAYADMAAKGYFHPNTVSNVFPAGQQDLANGQASMYLNASWVVNELMPVTGEDFPWGQMQFPTVPNGTGSANSANYGQNAFVIHKDCENIEEAFKFAVYLTTGEWDSKYAQATYSVPAGVDSEWPVQLTDAKEVFLSVDEWMPWSGGIEDNGDLVATIRTAFTELIGGQITPEQFVQRMVDM